LINVERVMSTRTEFALGSSIGQSTYLSNSRQVGRKAGERTRAAKGQGSQSRVPVSLTIALTDEACAVLGFAVGTGCVATGTTVKVGQTMTRPKHPQL
jgi:hypothetical protein